MMRLYKSIMSVTILVLICSMICGCAPEAKSFSAKGMTITLNDDFEENKDYYGMAYYDSEEAQVFVAKEEFSVLEEKGERTDFTLKEYADFLLKSISVTAEIKSEHDLTFFEYGKKPDDVNYYYFVSVYKTADAFWFVQFSCEMSESGEYRPLFIQWAQSIQFDS